MLNEILRTVRKFIPQKLFKALQPTYHYMLAFLGAVVCRFPSRKIEVIAVTGTKGKTSTVEFLNAILEEEGKKTALAGTLRFKIGERSHPNLFKMTMPGRFFMQRFLRKAVDAGCDYAIIEMSSEAVEQYRHKFIDLDALIFLNIAPEHIEAHGSFEKYLQAKLDIAKALARSGKRHKTIIANIDDKEGQKFLDIDVLNKIPYSIKDAEVIELSEDSTKFIYKGMEIKSAIPGRFNVYNMLGAIKFAEGEGIRLGVIKAGLEKLKEIKGRVESIKFSPKQNFKVIVDYAHTPDSLIALYKTFLNSKKIAVLGACGGGRDKWKRKEMMEIADTYCEKVILTDEDPYDDDPMEIVKDLARFFKKVKPEIILNRREAIAKAISYAKKGDVVLITGKGTDPYIMRADGEKEKWSDAEVVRDELKKLEVKSNK